MDFNNNNYRGQMIRQIKDLEKRNTEGLAEIRKLQIPEGKAGIQAQKAQIKRDADQKIAGYKKEEVELRKELKEYKTQLAEMKAEGGSCDVPGMKKEISELRVVVTKMENDLKVEKIKMKELQSDFNMHSGMVRALAVFRKPTSGQNPSTEITFPDIFTVQVHGTEYSVDRVYDPENRNVFEKLKDQVKMAFDGSNVVWITYGATGTGKSHILADGKGNGVAIQAFKESQASVDEMTKNQFQTKLTVNMVEISADGDKVTDLLGGSATNVYKDTFGWTYIANTTQKQVAKCAELGGILNSGIKKLSKKTSAFVFTLDICCKSSDPKVKHPWVEGRLRFIDLPGCEHAGKGLTSLGKLVEACSVDKGANAYDKAKKTFQENYMSKLLQDAIGGCALTTFLFTATTADPSQTNIESVLEMTQKVSKVKNVDEKRIDTDEIKNLRQEIEAIRVRGNK